MNFNRFPLLCLALILAGPLPALATDKAQGLLRINTTIQTHSVSQPWELNQPKRRRGLGAVLKNGSVLTTGEMAANSTYIEFESADGAHTVPALSLIHISEPTRPY